jgi:hypothetical protein
MIIITPLSCSDCPTGEYRTSDVGGLGVCKACGHVVDLDADVRPHLDINERLTTQHNGTSTPDVVIHSVEPCEFCGSTSRGHFTVGNDLCPNDSKE